ncbi:hypothetical protein DS67_06130 [Mesotoga sp. SC_4PWA21]|nr:hypothetical protein DS67_06130 [Mesotoga sp. SC_4PWA21]
MILTKNKEQILAPKNRSFLLNGQRKTPLPNDQRCHEQETTNRSILGQAPNRRPEQEIVRAGSTELQSFISSWLGSGQDFDPWIVFKTRSRSAAYRDDQVS